MAIEGRSGVLTGQTIILRVLMLDDKGQPRDSDVLPSVYIYDANVDSTTIYEEIDSNTFTSAIAGPLSPTQIGTGYYELSYSVPSGGAEGIWSDVWVGSIDGVSVASIQKFKVIAGAEFTVQKLQNNEAVYVELSKDIAALADPTKTLGQDILWSFFTVFNPYYASVELVRLEAGPLVEYIPDDTLALMIHWSSKEADQISPKRRCGDRYPYWRTRFVIVDAALHALTLPGGAYLHGLNNGLGDTKSLGELSISKADRGPRDVMSGGIDKETYDAIKKLRDELWRVVNAGGCINPGQSLGFTSAIRGLYDPSRRRTGRQWASPDDFFYMQPVANTKLRRLGDRHFKFGQTDWRPRHTAAPWRSRFTGRYYRGKYYFD